MPIDIALILSSFAALFLAEMGDKTQLLAIALAQRYPVVPVIGGVLSAFLLLNLVAVWVGEALVWVVPQQLVLVAAASLFLFFGYRFVREARMPNEAGEGKSIGGHRAFVASFSLVFLAELGDKTQLALVALVAGTGNPWAVFVGGTLGLWTVSLVSIFVGSRFVRRFPKVWIHYSAAGLFFRFGAIMLLEAWREIRWRAGPG